MKKLVTLFLCLSVFFASGISAAVSADNSVHVRVGMNENPPKIFTDEKGNVSGFWPDILGHIASAEGWNIEYIHGTWNECLERLKKNEIDILPGIGHTEERDRIYDFSNEMVYISWSIVYAKKGAGIECILDLEGKKVAVLQGSLAAEGPGNIKQLVEDFNVNCTFVEVGSYARVFELVDNTEADAGAVSKDFGSQNEAKYDVMRTPIVFQPSHLYFAFTKGSSLSPYLITRIDSRVRQMKQDGSSIYYRSIEKWFGAEPIEKPVIPDWLKWLLIGFAGLAVLLAAIPVVIKIQVNKKITALTKEITESHQQYLELAENLSSGVAVYQAVNEGNDFVIVDFNRAGERIEKTSRDKVIGKSVLDVFPGVKEFGLFEVFQRVWHTGEPEHFPISFYKDNRISGWRENYVYKLPDGKIVAQYDDVTQLKQAEEALKESEEKFSKAFNATPNPMIITTQEGYIIEVNDDFCRMTGYKREECIGHMTAELNFWANPGQRDEIVKQVKDTGYAHNIEVNLRNRSGKIRSFLFSMDTIKLGNTNYLLSIAVDITARKLNEEHLRESERRFHGTLDNMLEGCQIIGFDWRYLYINEAGATHGRRSKEELIGHTMMEMYPGIENTEMFAQLRRCMEKRVVHHMENEFVYPDGTTSWFELGIEPVPEGVFILSLDITERKKAAEALRESEEKFSKAFSFAGNAICITDLSNGKFIEVNESYSRFTGYTREEAIGHTAAELNLWVDDSELKNFMRTLTEEGRFFNQEFRSRHKSGEIRIGLGSAEIVNIGGKPHRIVIITDITERKESEEALKESEEFNSTLLKNTPNAIFVTYPNGTIRHVNPAFEKLTGFSLTEIFGIKTPYPWWPDNMKQEIEAGLKRTVQEEINLGNELTKQMTFQKKNGELFIVELSAAVINKDGNRQYIMVVWSDITERKKAEEALKESEQRYRSLFKNMAEGLAYCRMLYHDGVPVDWVYLDINPAFEIITGMKGVKGKSVSSLIPGLRESNPELFEKYGSVAAGGPPEHFESYVPELGIWFSVWAYSPSSEHFVAVFEDITERKKAEEALKESEENFRHSIDDSPIGIYIVSADAKTIYANQAMLTLYGYDSSEELESTPIKKRFTPESYGILQERIEKTKRGEYVPPNIEMNIVRKDGQIRYVNIYRKEVLWNGKTLFQVIYLDMTQRKQAEDALKTSEENFRHSLDDSPLGIRIADTNLDTLYLNQAIIDIYGYGDAREFNSIPIEKHFTPEGYQHHLELRKKMKLGEPTPGKIETSIVRKDGDIRSLEVMRKDVLWNGKTQHMLLYEDITERKQSEAKLRTAEQNFRNSLDSSPLGIFVTTKSNEIIYANKAILDIYGCSSIDELRNMPVNERLTPESYKEYLERIAKHERDEPVPAIFESGIVRKTGEVRYVAIWRKEVEWNGETQYQVIHQDITERKRTEAKLITAEQNFRNSLDNSPLGIRIVTKDGELIYVNRAMLEIYGFDSLDELRNTPSRERYTPKSYLEHQERVKMRQASVPVPDSYETDIIRKTGEIRHLAVYRKELVWNGETQYQVIYQDNTEHRQMEKKVADSENRYRRLFETAQDAILILNGDTGQIIDANPFIKDLLGYSMEELKGKNLWEIGELKDTLASKISYRKLHRTGYVRYEHLPLVTKDGRQVDVEVVANAYPVDHMKVIQCNIRDITERKQAEVKLKTAEENFRNSLDSSPLGIIIVNKSGKINYANKAMLEIYEYESIEELKNTPVKERFTPESYVKYRERVEKHHRGELIPANYETDIVRKTGEVRHVTVLRKEVVWNGENQDQVVYQDITESKQAEELFKTLALNSPVGVYIIQDKKFVYTNPQFQKITGFEERELSEINSLDMVVKEDRDKVRDNAIKMLKGKLSSPYEFKITHKDGEIRWASESVAPIQYRGKNAVIGSFQDITGTKRAEEQLIVTDRLASIGELVSGIAHEMNNPLTGVIGLSDLLLTRKGLPEDMKDDLQMINKEAHRTASVVRNLLTFARKHPLEKKPIDVEGVIKMVLELRAYEQKVQNILIVTQFTPGLPQVNANAFQIMQVFVNIIINAEFFMIEAHHKGTLIIKTEQVGKAIRTTLVDDGTGIPRENMSKLFNPFFTTKEVGKGTGLGLSICHGIITEHGGRIWAESKPGKGATFFIELPVLRKNRRK